MHRQIDASRRLQTLLLDNRKNDKTIYGFSRQKLVFG